MKRLTGIGSVRNLLLLRLLGVILAIVLVQVWIYSREYHRARAEALQTDLAMSQAVADSFNSWLEDVLRLENSIRHAFVLLQPSSQQQATSYLKNSAAAHSEIRTLSRLDEHGVVLASTAPELVGYDYSNTDWFKEFATGKPWLVTNAIRSRAPGRTTFSVVESIHNARDTFDGAIMAVIDPEKLAPWFKIGHTPGAAFNIVDRSGWLVYRNPSGQVAYEQRDWQRQYFVVREALQGKKSAGRVFAGYQNKYQLAAAVPISSIGWTAGAGRAEDEVLGPIRSTTFDNIALLVGVSVLALIAAELTARRITTPLTNLRRHALAVARGDLSQRVEVAGPTELRDVAGAFNRMAEEVQTREQDHEQRLYLERERVKDAAVLAAIQEAAPNGLAYVDCDMRFIQVNSVYAAIMGLSREELVGRLHADVFPHSADMRLHLAQVLEKGEPVELRELPRPAPYRTDVTELYLDIDMLPAKDDQDEIVGAIISVLDVTEKVKQRRQVEQNERARAEFAENLNAEINHRMKNNLMMLAGVLEMQAMEEPAGSRLADALRDATARIAALSVVHEHLYEGKSGQVELRDVIGRICQVALRAMAGSHAELAVSGDQVYVTSKLGSTLSMLANELITNALKHGAPGPTGKLHIKIKLARANGELRLSVWNSGNPVGADFDMASQQRMGLYLAKTIVQEQLKGRFSLRPADGGTIGEVVLDEKALGS